jgi:superfamily II DNA or RNA helicase
MLTLNGYLVRKPISNEAELKKKLTIKPYIPKVFVNPKYVTSYQIYQETEANMYFPKSFGIETFGLPAETTREVAKTDPKFWDFQGSLRPIQTEVVNSFLLPTPHDGIISLQTGGGKTVCALYIASKLQYPTLILVHNTFLRDQWEERVKAFLPKARIGRIQAKVVDVENKDVVIAMLQTVSMREIPLATFKPIGFVIVDECHHIASEVFIQSLPKVTSKFMLGLSATPDRKDGLMFAINWFLGPILYNSEQKDKIDDSIQVEVYEYKNDDPVFNEIVYNRQGVMFTSLMINKLAECEDRTKWLVRIIEDLLADEERQILVLTDRVQHAKDISKNLPEELTGILSQNIKSADRTLLCNSKRILIATYSMCKEGFDVSSLNTLVMSTPRPDIDQIVGRILRVEKKARKIHPLIVDIVDPQFRRQFGVRNTLYKQRDYEVKIMKLD